MAMNDATTPVGELKKWIQDFVDERDWNQFHSPKNLVMALSIEVAELMEHFQWISPQASREIADDHERFQGVREEIADVLCYVLALANELDIDLVTAVSDKMRTNEKKYPADEYRGRYGPEDPGPA